MTELTAANPAAADRCIAAAGTEDLLNKLMRAVSLDKGNTGERAGRPRAHSYCEPAVHCRGVAAKYTRPFTKLDQRPAADQAGHQNADEQLL